MAIAKRKAPKKDRAKLLAAAMEGPHVLAAYRKRESERYERERIKFLQRLAAELELEREQFGSDIEWLFELAFRLASDRYASAGDRGRSSDPLSHDDWELWDAWNGKKEKAPNASARAISESLVKLLPEWKKEFEKAKKQLAGRPYKKVEREIAEKIRQRYRTIAPKIQKLGAKI
jgi:hypothetical protein